MKKLVISGATLQCNQGTSTSSLSVVASNVDGNQQKAATVNDYEANTNVPPFGMCQSLSNPQVASATASAQGVLTPQPCNPVITSAWSPGSGTVKYANAAALTDDSTCSCAFGGTISITVAGSSTLDTD